MRNLENKKITNNNVGAGYVSANGITLIALVFTIVILIILAGVAISLSLGENGIFTKARKATGEYANEQAKEESQIAKISNEIDEYVGANRDTINNYYGMFMDTSKVLATLEANTEYVATEDCVILGYAALNYSKSSKRISCQVMLNDVQIMYMGAGTSSNVEYYPINFYVKKGQKVKINILQTANNTVSSDGTILVNAYGLLK